MTAEEMERAIGFLLESQAKHDAQIGELREQVAELHSVIKMQSESQSQFNETITQAISSLIESQRRADSRIDRLIGVVERLAEARG
jgi:flagellar hook-basal body complex protein FliE